MAKMTIVLRDNESTALRILAEREQRYPRDQAVLLIRRGLQQADLLPTDSPQPFTAQPAQLAQAVSNDGHN